MGDNREVGYSAREGMSQIRRLGVLVRRERLKWAILLRADGRRYQRPDRTVPAIVCALRQGLNTRPKSNFKSGFGGL